MTKTLELEVVSDFACPWCYIGKRRLDDAIVQTPGVEVVVRWRPFQLNPDMPREGRDLNQYYDQKFGEHRLRELKATIKEVGREEGIGFEYRADAVAPNTLSAHTLMNWAQTSEGGDSDAVAEKIFHAHHVANENIGDHKVLARIAGEAGMNAGIVLENLAAGLDEERTSAMVREAYQMGVTGVPFLILDRRYSIPGAQPVATLASALTQVWKETSQ